MQKIALTGKFGNGSYTLVDDELYESFSHWKWQANETGHVRRHTRGGTVHMHRSVLEAYGLVLPIGKFVDHLDGNPLNNQRSNLRPATAQQNNINRGKRSYNTSGFKGVTKHRSSHGMWMARIGEGGRYIYCGIFTTAEEAAYVYDQFALSIYGQYAYLNVIK